ncbi:MAG TPA: hypothetical protein VK421_17005 [Pyrinomonadaceae bacterium]|nr:hypothetical protein [Pyrinomonadaceae bacterium]
MQTQGSATADKLFWHGDTPCPGADEQIYDPFRATVRCKGADGRRHSVETVLDSFSRRGLCVRLSREMKEGERLFAVVSLSDQKDGEVAPPRVAVLGTVLRVEKRPSRAYGLAVKITRYRLL